MFNIDFFQAKNQQETCCINGIPLHSKYDPAKEAFQFADSIQCDFIPAAIVITEPGIGYIVEPLKKKFPNAEIFIIRYTNLFDRFNKNEKIIYAIDNFQETENRIFEAIGDEKLCQSLFISWRASSKIFNRLDNIVWACIKNAVEKAKTILVTRSYFSKKWIYNSFNIIRNIMLPATIKKGNSPLVITASGPSLKNCIPALKKHRKNIFILSLSSSLSVLINENIIPDAVLSTDGGFWATRHLKKLSQNNKIPLILSIEGAVLTKILKQNTVCPIIVRDSFANKIESLNHYPFPKVFPNGTVSGTAIEVGRILTDGKIFFCGLDLSTSKAFQHCLPNEIESDNFAKENRIQTSETRCTASYFSTSSLKIYENWFSSLNETYSNEIYRLSNNYKYKNRLNNIKDVSIDFFEKEISIFVNNKKDKTIFKNIENFEKEKILFEFIKIINNNSFLEEINPMKKILINKFIDKNTAKKEIIKLEEEADEFRKKIKKRFYSASSKIK